MDLQATAKERRDSKRTATEEEHIQILEDASGNERKRRKILVIEVNGRG